MPRVTVPGFGSISFPDTMSEDEIRRALDRMRDDGELDHPRDAYQMPASGPLDLRQAKRAELDAIRQSGDIGPGRQPGTVDHGDRETIPGLGHTDVSDDMRTSRFNMMPDVSEQSKSQRYLRETVLDRGFGWAVGGAERLGLVPEGTRQAIRENQAEAADDYLTAHPEGDLGRAVLLAGGDVAASVAGPQALLGPGSGALAGRMALARGAEPAVARLAGIAGGAAEGMAQSWLDNPDTPNLYGAADRDLSSDELHARNAEKVKAIGMGALLGGLGGAHAVNVPEETRAVVTVDGRSTPTLSHEQYRPTQREIDLGLRTPTLDDARALAAQSLSIGEKRLAAAAERSNPANVRFDDLPDRLGEQAYGQYLSERQAVEMTVDADAANRASYGKPMPPEIVERIKADRLAALEDSWHARAAHAASITDDPALHALADDTEMAIVWESKAPARTPPKQLSDAADVNGMTAGAATGDGIGRFKPSEAGYIQLPRSTTPAVGADPMESVIRYPVDTAREPVRVRLRKLADRWTDEMVDKEDAPVRALRRAGLGNEAKTLEKYIARARGSARIAKNVIFNGVELWDPVTGNSRRIHDSYQSIVGGLDGQAERDLNNYMAARHHMELVSRRERALTEHDIASAYRREVIKAAREADRQSVGRMARGVDEARQAEVGAARAEELGTGEARGRLAGEAALEGESGLVVARGERLEDEALLAAEATRETGFDQASAEYAAAAQYARALVREELANAVAPRRPGSTQGLTTGDSQARSPRSPAALSQAEAASRAVSRAAERMGVEEGRMRALLATSRSFDAAASSLDSAASRQADAAGSALARAAAADANRSTHSADFRQALTSMKRVVMGIRDQAKRLRSQHPPVEMHPDGRLAIDEAGTAVARQTLDDLASRYAGGLARTDLRTGWRSVTTLEDLSQRIRDWSKAAVVEQLDSVGYFKPGMKEAMLQANREYAPFFRLLDSLDDDPDIATIARLSGGTEAQPLKRISGGLSPDKPIAPPLESFVAQAQKVALWVDRQRVRNMIGDYAETNGDVLGSEVRRVKPGEKGSGQGSSFHVFRDGERHTYTASPEILNALERVPRQAGIVMQAAVFASRMLRAGATLTPDFAVSNFFRDQASAGAYGAEFRYRPFADFFAGLFAQTAKGKELHDWVSQWESSGGALSDIISSSRPQTALTSDAAAGLITFGGKKYQAPRLAKTYAAWRAETNVFAKTLWPLLAPFEAASEKVEQATRIGAFRRAKMSGASDLDAGFYSRNITLDFGRSGSFAQTWNGVEAFANASLQDVSRFSRAMRERPVATTVSALVYLTLPALASYYRYRDDPAYQGLPEWDKAAFIPAAKRDDGRWWRIPRPQGLLNTIFSYGAERMFSAAAKDGHGDAVKQLLANLFQETPLRYSPLQPGSSEFESAHGSLEWIPSAGQPIAEIMAGEGGMSSYRGGDAIVPQGLQGALPEDQSLDQTTQTAKTIGRALGTSPLKIDYLIRGYGASLGWSTVNLAERAAGAKGDSQEPALPMTAKDIPAVGRLISSSPYGFASQPVVDFYQLADASERAATSLRMAGKQGRVSDYQRILRERPEAMPEVVSRLRETRKELKELREMQKEYRTKEGLDPATRQDMLLSIDMQITQLAAGYMHWASDYLHGYRAGRPAPSTVPATSEEEQ